MGETTGIAWTDSTFNGWVGCQRVSPGCVNCYAEAQDHRWRPGKERWGPTAERTRTSPANWRKPLQWNARATKLGIRHRVFCSSLADVFEDRPEIAPWRSDLFDLIAATPMLDWQLLTKRPENIARLMPSVTGYEPDAPFVKQMGDNAVASGRDQFSLLAMKAHHGTDPSEWPIDLRVQEFPEARRG